MLLTPAKSSAPAIADEGSTAAAQRPSSRRTLLGLLGLDRGPAHLVALAAQTVLAIPAAWQAAILAWIFAARANYPMDIEWMEGGELYHAYRLLHGMRIFGPPSQGFLPFPYPPAYYSVVAAIGALFRVDYVVGRLVSATFFVIACAVLAREAARAWAPAGRALAAAALAVGTIVVSFEPVGGWYDLIRVDSMAIGLATLGVGIVSAPKVSTKRAVVAGIVFALAVFAKQTSVFFIGYVTLFLFVYDWRRAIVFGATSGATSGIGLLALRIATRGWFWTYAFTNLSKHEVRIPQGMEGAMILLRFAPFVVAVPLVVLALLATRRISRRGVLWVGFFAVAFFVSLMGFAKAGGWRNNLIPAALLAGPVTLILWADVARAPARHPRVGAAIGWVGLALAALFVVERRLDVHHYLPTAVQRQRVTALNAWIASLDGEVMIPNHPFLPIRNGKTTPQVHEMAYEDCLGARLPGVQLATYLRTVRARYLILGPLQNGTFKAWVRQVYDPIGSVPVRAGTLTGFGSYPRELLELRREVPRHHTRLLFDFEQADWSGWTISGDAFGVGPAREIRFQSRIEGRVGLVANSFGATKFDAATGVAVSPPFVLDRNHVGLLVGGGEGPRVRVELRVDDGPVRRASGAGTEAMIPTVWDVSEYVGKDAVIAIVDEDERGWGHIMVDQVELFDDAE